MQELLTATVQNILVYVRYAKDRRSRAAAGLRISTTSASVSWYRRNLMRLRSQLNHAPMLVERACVM
ncbi:hypothetical protein D3OALGB2SA_1596, partial [Olavius algarvensis associated proteobacterium Delta 3]